MKTTNFEFLKANHAELYQIAAAAELSIYDAPIKSALYTRAVVESILNHLFVELSITLHSDQASALIYDTVLRQCLSEVAIFDNLKRIIHVTEFIETHPDFIKENSLSLLNSLHHIALWFNATANNIAHPDQSSFDISNAVFIRPILALDSITKIQVADPVSLMTKLIEARQYLATKINKPMKDKTLINQGRQLFIHRSETAVYQLNNYALPEFNFDALALSDYFKTITLTASQAILIAKLEAFLEDDSQHVFIIKGHAGTGKTFMTRMLTTYLQDKKLSMTLAAPTGKAAEVLTQKSARAASTVHSIIYERVKPKDINFNAQNASLRVRNTFKLKSNISDSNHIYIFDEASMIGNNKSGNQEFLEYGSGYLLNDIMEYIDPHFETCTRKTIFIGDPAQLPPVGSEFSPALNKGELELLYNLNVIEFELTDVVRQQNKSGILENATYLRSLIFSAYPTSLKLKHQFADVNVSNTSLSSETIDLYFNHLKNKNQKTNAILLAYSNARVNHFNQLIHRQLFPGQESICAGDKVMVYESNSLFQINNGAIGYIKSLNDEIIEREVAVFNTATKRIENIILKFREANLTFPGRNGNSLILMNYFEAGTRTSKDNGYESLLKRALMVDFHNRFLTRHSKADCTTEKFFDELESDRFYNALLCRLGYAVTIHKAQGSEWDNVFVDYHARFSSQNTEALRALYTAITRCKTNLHFLNTPNYVLDNPMVTDNSTALYPTSNFFDLTSLLAANF